jgi:hypothetical protein
MLRTQIRDIIMAMLLQALDDLPEAEKRQEDAWNFLLGTLEGGEPKACAIRALGVDNDKGNGASALSRARGELSEDIQRKKNPGLSFCRWLA